MSSLLVIQPSTKNNQAARNKNKNNKSVAYGISAWIYWRVEYLANQLVIVVGITLIWRKAVAAVHINSYKTLLVLFKFGGQTKNCQTAKLKSSSNMLHIRYVKYK